MPLPVSSRSRSVVLRGRRESERQADTTTAAAAAVWAENRTANTPDLFDAALPCARCGRHGLFGVFFRCLFGFFFSSFERNLTPPKIKDKPSSFRNRECALSPLRLNTPIRSVTFRSAQSLPRWVLRLLGWVRKYGKAPVGGRKLFKLMKTGLILHCCSLIWY